MIRVQRAVEINAILVYLDRVGGTATLGGLAAHFGTGWQRILEALWEANTAEMWDGRIPFTLDLPLPPGQEEPGEERASALSSVSFVSGQARPLALTLDEAMAVLAVLDLVAEVTSPGPELAALASTRSAVSDGLAQAGFDSVLWAPPVPVAAPSTTAAIATALEHTCYLKFSYFSPAHPEGKRVKTLPVDVTPGGEPLLRAFDSELHHYRLDRMADVRTGDAASASTLETARRAAAQETAWQPGGERVTITVTQAARWLAESVPVSAITRGENIEIVLRARSETWLASLLAQVGGALVSIKPASVAARMAQIFRELAETAAPANAADMVAVPQGSAAVNTTTALPTTHTEESA